MTVTARGRLIVSAIALAALVFAGTASAAGDGPLSSAQKDAVENIVREYLKENPEILVEAIRALRTKQEEAKRQQAQAALVAHSAALRNDPASPVGGNLNGDVTIVEFFDYRCGFCKRVFPAIMTLLGEDPNIRYVFKEFPILGPESEFASRAAQAVWFEDQNKYMPFHHALMGMKGNLTEARVLKEAEKIGIDTERLRTAMASPEVTSALQSNYALAKALGINGTPAFVIGDELVPGALDIAALKRLIVDARKG